jgi:hypothetical protein
MDDDKFPPWANELTHKSKAGIAHCFILHFNVSDVVLWNKESRPLVEFLALLFGEHDMIIHYDISGGIKFLKGTEKEFNRIAGIKEEQTNPLAEVTGLSSQGLAKNASTAFPRFEKMLTTNADPQKKWRLS